MSEQSRIAVLTPIAIAVLGLLEERPMHPYEMHQLLLKRREDNLIKLRPSSLYHTVSRLVESGLIRQEGTERAGNRPERTTYSITAAGAEAVRARIAEIIRRPAREYPIFPLGLAESHNLPADEVVALIGERIDRLEDDLVELDAIRAWAVDNDVPRRYWVAVDFLRDRTAHETEWLRRLIGEIRDGSLAWQNFDAGGARIPDPPRDPGRDWSAALTDETLAELRRSAVGDPGRSRASTEP
ncbi:transcriptional regulator [Rhodococcus gordoniae]|uniref:Transcriptional regulator n=1 Tax=Rhodococcus gordoniae TaxID=223392 RepID=A0A379LVJ7_9NOCA|nr:MULTISPECIES: PadR family transcriptional regulator [Rhodococcus]UTT46795.1 PadR family transcriptional regulator [Rhodococcus gordoniae]SUE14049.1 transcriptional regulator [Rhodococcus gordoniae]